MGVLLTPKGRNKQGTECPCTSKEQQSDLRPASYLHICWNLCAQFLFGW